MTSYWDTWGSIINAVFKGDERIPVELFKDALESLVSALHSYDHDHGGHVLDNWCEQHGMLSTYVEMFRCSLKTRGGGMETGHHWLDGKCLYCKAPQAWFNDTSKQSKTGETNEK